MLAENEHPFYVHRTDFLVFWQTVLELNRPEALRFLELAQVTGSHPSRVRALESLLVNNYAMRLVDEVERAKIGLSTSHFASIELNGDEFGVWQPITRSQFEAITIDAIRSIEMCLLDTVERSGLDVEEIDAVVRTGGSSQIPCFIGMMERIFGQQKVVLSSVFGGVTAGLAIRAGS